MAKKAITVAFGDGFIFPELSSIVTPPNIDPSVLGPTPKKKKLTSQEEEVLVERLAESIEARSAPDVQAVFDAGLKMPLKLRGDKSIFLLVKNFDPAVASVLASNKLPVPYGTVLLRLSAQQPNPAVCSWLKSYMKIVGISDIQEVEYRRMVDTAQSRGHAATLAEIISWPEGVKLSPYDLYQSFQIGVDKNHPELMDQVLRRAFPTGRNANSALQHWVQRCVGKLSYTNCLDLQAFLATASPQSAANWSSLFPIAPSERSVSYSSTSHPSKWEIRVEHKPIPDFLHLLIAQGAPGVATLVGSSVARPIVANILKNPDYLVQFLKESSASTRTAVRSALSKELSGWTDKDGNTWSHYAIATSFPPGRPTKALCDELYQQSPDDLLTPNALGQTATDMISDTTLQSQLNKRLIKKALNNQGTGLVSNRTTSGQRRM